MKVFVSNDGQNIWRQIPKAMPWRKVVRVERSTGCEVIFCRE